jgi:hypothetical protein
MKPVVTAILTLLHKVTTITIIIITIMRLPGESRIVVVKRNLQGQALQQPAWMFPISKKLWLAVLELFPVFTINTIHPNINIQRHPYCLQWRKHLKQFFPWIQQALQLQLVPSLDLLLYQPALVLVAVLLPHQEQYQQQRQHVDQLQRLEQ